MVFSITNQLSDKIRISKWHPNLYLKTAPYVALKLSCTSDLQHENRAQSEEQSVYLPEMSLEEFEKILLKILFYLLPYLAREVYHGP